MFLSIALGAIFLLGFIQVLSELIKCGLCLYRPDFYTVSVFCFQFFFVLHKKFEHVSTLHVIHHGCMPLSVWFGVKFTPGKVVKCMYGHVNEPLNCL